MAGGGGAGSGGSSTRSRQAAGTGRPRPNIPASPDTPAVGTGSVSSTPATPGKLLSITKLKCLFYYFPVLFSSF